jgi:cysteine sulfinate desulfinase/cysteine desulfurase-like protein
MGIPVVLISWDYAPSQAILTARYQILHSVVQCPNVDVAIADPDPTSNVDEHKVDSKSISSTTKTTTTPLSSCLFTSGGTEADNLMIHIALQVWTIRSNMQRSKCESSASTSLSSQQQQQPKSMMPHFVTTNVEHPAIETYLSTLEQQQHCTVTRVPVQAIDGRVTASDMITAIQSNTYAILYFLLLLLLYGVHCCVALFLFYPLEAV